MVRHCTRVPDQTLICEGVQCVFLAHGSEVVGCGNVPLSVWSNVVVKLWEKVRRGVDGHGSAKLYVLASLAIPSMKRMAEGLFDSKLPV